MSRRRVAAAGILLIGAYAGLAAISGHLSPLARRPLLDGLGPLPYRWVNPPPELASTNQPPSSVSQSLTLTPTGVKGEVVITPDKQAIVILPDDAIPPHGDDKTVKMTVDPIDPATLAPPGDDLAFFGNAYRISATYEPSGTPVKRADGVDVSLVFPTGISLHASSHEILWSGTGEAWRPLDTNDSTQQAEAVVPGLGYQIVAGVPSANPVSPSGGSSGRSTLAVGLIVGAICALLVGIGLLLRSRGK